MMNKKCAIYHFTDQSKKRPIINEKQLLKLQDFAIEKGFLVNEIYCDRSLLKKEQTEFKRFISDINKFTALITKDFYHISRNTMNCMSIMKELKNKGVQVYSIENGYFSWEDAPFQKTLRIATYCCRFGDSHETKEILPLDNDILKLFTIKKTNWIVVDQYFDAGKSQTISSQPHLQELVRNKNKYDMILVHNLNDIHWRTANFCKFREKLQLDIYSLQDGYLKYEKQQQPKEDLK